MADEERAKELLDLQRETLQEHREDLLEEFLREGVLTIPLDFGKSAVYHLTDCVEDHHLLAFMDGRMDGTEFFEKITLSAEDCIREITYEAEVDDGAQ